jgi:uncharacterized membrane protein
MASPTVIARYATLMLSALSAGVFFGTRTSLGPSTRELAPATYVEVQQATVRNLRPVMGVLLPAAVTANAVLLALGRRQRRSRAFALTAASLAAQLSALVLTAAIELPINARVLTWSPQDPPPGWQDVRDRWAGVHTARTASSVAGLACLAAACVGAGSPT